MEENRFDLQLSLKNIFLNQWTSLLSLIAFWKFYRFIQIQIAIRYHKRANRSAWWENNNRNALSKIQTKLPKKSLHRRFCNQVNCLIVTPSTSSIFSWRWVWMMQLFEKIITKINFQKLTSTFYRLQSPFVFIIYSFLYEVEDVMF